MEDVGRSYGVEEGHARAHLDVIYNAEDALQVLVCLGQECPRDFAETQAEHGMLQVGPRLVVTADAKILRIDTVAQTLELREDEPNPVGAFAAVFYLTQGLCIVLLLRHEKAIEVEIALAYVLNDEDELSRQEDVLHLHGSREERGYVLRTKTGNAATNLRHEETEFGMLAGEPNELVDVGPNSFHPTLHRGNGIGLAVQAYAFTPYGTKVTKSETGCTATVVALQVAAKDEDFAGRQGPYIVGSKCSVVHGQVHKAGSENRFKGRGGSRATPG